MYSFYCSGLVLLQDGWNIMDVGLGLSSYTKDIAQDEILASKEGSPEKVEFLSKDLTEDGGDTVLSQREVKSMCPCLPDEMVEKILECIIASYGSCNTSYELRAKLSDITRLSLVSRQFNRVLKDCNLFGPEVRVQSRKDLSLVRDIITSYPESKHTYLTWDNIVTGNAGSLIFKLAEYLDSGECNFTNDINAIILIINDLDMDRLSLGYTALDSFGETGESRIDRSIHHSMLINVLIVLVWAIFLYLVIDLYVFTRSLC